MSRIYFPLRSNAHSLMAGPGVASVIKRIKIASLLHDEVVLGSGRTEVAAGPYGSQVLIGPADASTRWDSPHRRHQARQGAFEIWAPVRVPSGGDSHLDRIVRAEVPTIAWGATFEPLRRELRRRHDWFDFADFELLDDDRTVVRALVDADTADDRLRVLVGNAVAQRLVAEDTAQDLVVASRIEAAVSMDDTHMRVTTARIERGEAVAATGGDALMVLVPGVASLSWDELGELRKHGGLRSLRSVLADLETKAWDAYQRGGGLEQAIDAEYRTLLEQGQRYSLSLGNIARVAAASVAISLVTGAMPFAPALALGAAAEVAREVIHARRFGRSWLAALLEIRHRSGAVRAGQT